MLNNKDVAIVISSCDKYEYLWDQLFNSFEKFWPDCPFKIYLVSDTKVPTFSVPFDFEPKISKITLSNSSADWSNNLKTVLTDIPESYILYTQEDYLLTNRVDNNQLFTLLTYIIDNNVSYVRLQAAPSGNGAKIHIDDSIVDIVEILPHTEWRTSLLPSIWNKSVLNQLLLPNQTPWQFEFNSVNSDKFDRFYCVDCPEHSGEFFKVCGIYFTTLPPFGGLHEGAKKFMVENGFTTQKDGTPFNMNIRL